MALAAYADPARSPLGLVPDDDGEATALFCTELLGRLPELCDHPARARDLWAEEDAVLRASEAAIAAGAVTIEEVPELDLAVVSAPEDAPDGGGHRFAHDRAPGLHPMAVHGATARTALLTVRGRRCTFGYRYESWVQFRSRPVRRRVDLAPLAARLDAAESGPTHWVAEPVSALTPALAPADGAESNLDPPAVRAMVEEHLRTAPPAWDPFSATG